MDTCTLTPGCCESERCLFTFCFSSTSTDVAYSHPLSRLSACLGLTELTCGRRLLILHPVKWAHLLICNCLLWVHWPASAILLFHLLAITGSAISLAVQAALAFRLSHKRDAPHAAEHELLCSWFLCKIPPMGARHEAYSLITRGVNTPFTFHTPPRASTHVSICLLVPGWCH